ncbi:MAG: hypothetical protein FWB81_02850 [Cystobacterineae bacterium]|nr:hypothetical protein [Cystobacterineae bacterium]
MKRKVICLVVFLVAPWAWGQAWVEGARLFSPEEGFPKQLEARVAERKRIDSHVMRSKRLAAQAEYEKALKAKRRFFVAKTSRQAVEALTARFVAEGADAKQAEELLRRVLKVLQADAKHRKRTNELSVGAAFWLMSCERILNGRQLNEESYAMLMAGLDEVFEGYLRLDKTPSQQKQTSFETMGMLGGIIAGLELESQKDKDSEGKAQAAKLAQESLVLFQLTPQSLGETIRLLIWLGSQRS